MHGNAFTELCKFQIMHDASDVQNTSWYKSEHKVIDYYFQLEWTKCVIGWFNKSKSELKVIDYYFQLEWTKCTIGWFNKSHESVSDTYRSQIEVGVGITYGFE